MEEGNMNTEIQVLVQQELQRLLSSDPTQAIMLAARAIEQANNEKSALQHHINTELMPIVDMYEKVMGTDKLCDMKQVAKILNYKNLGRNKLFDYLQEKGIISEHKEPYQRFVDAGYFKVVEESFENNGYNGVYLKTVVTQKGIDYIGKLLKEDNYERNPR
jgi:anti-repressor protein